MKNTIQESLEAALFSFLYYLLYKLLGIEITVCCGIGQIIAAITFINKDKT
tara:strand:+ start:416 stop:568 length:153 start_codon:yes stop_codon:yes gene_type:complete